jgi:hypothetical protein
MSIAVKSRTVPGDLFKPQNVIVVDSEDPEVKIHGTWTQESDRNATDLTYIYSSTAGDYLQLQFMGTGVWLRFYLLPDGGYADISIDGGDVKTLDTYAGHKRITVTFVASNLKFGLHTIKVTVKGSHIAGSEGYKVAVDAFIVELSRGSVQMWSMIEKPDYVEETVPPKLTEYPTKESTTPVAQRWMIVAGTDLKSAPPLTTDYIKEAIILPNKVPCADPTGGIPSYEAGWVTRALIYKNGLGEVALAGDVLAEMEKVQYADGSWEQQYYPTRLPDGTHDIVVAAGAPYHDIQVDSGAGLLAWAMADYDKKQGTTVFKETVRKAFDFLRECQIQHHNKYPGSYLLANQRWDYRIGSPKWNYGAFACDSAECLLAAHAALDTYGSDLTNTNGYSIKTWGNDVYKSLATLCWTGNADPAAKDDAYFRTEYPAGADMWLMPAGIVPQAISYAQGIVAFAIYRWAKSALRDPSISDYSYLCERALNFACALTQGKWGGFYYHPIQAAYGKGISGDGFGLYDEFPSFAACMIFGMKEVNEALYQYRINRAINFIRLASLPGGLVANRIKIDGTIDLGEAFVWGDGMHFRSLNIAQGLLAGA